MTIFTGASWDGGTRHSGLFANPNNLALIPFLLLFLVDPVADKLILRIAAHTVVVAVLAFSGTSGAVVAYTIGPAVYLGGVISKTWRVLVYTSVLAGGLGAVGFLALWRRTIVTYMDRSPAQQLVGFGLGSSPSNGCEPAGG